MPAMGAPLHAGASQAAIASPASPGAPFAVDALVLEAGQAYVAFCTVDVAALDRSLLDAVALRLEEGGSAIGRDNLLLSATGDPSKRCPGLMRSFLGEVLVGPFEPSAQTEAADVIAAVIAEAEGALQPASARIAETEAPELHAPRDGASSTADSTVCVLAVASRDAKALACLVNYALEPALPFAQAQHSVSANTGGRPGAIALAVQEALGAAIPVLFCNGAAGDLASAMAPGGDTGESAAELGRTLAGAVRESLETAGVREEVVLSCRTREVLLPPTLLGEMLPVTTVLQEVRLDDTVFLSMPGAPAAQIGLLLRVRAMMQGAEHVFLLGLTGDYLGFQPTIEEFFAATPEACCAFYGPLMVKWYGDQHLRGKTAQEEPAWMEVPALGRFASGFGAALERGRVAREAIAAHWAPLSAALDQAGGKMPGFGDVPKEFFSVLSEVDAAQATAFGKAGMAVHVRREFADFTEEQRAILMGLAEGASVPFDALLLLQVFSHPERLPEEAAAAVQALNVAGCDFFAN